MQHLGPRLFLATAAVLAVLAAGIGPASAQTLTTIRDNGPSSNRLDIVVLGDGYTPGELPKYASDVEKFIQGFFVEDVFNEYQNYFNVHRIDVISSESGADHPSRNPSVFKNTALDGTYDCAGIQRLTCVNNSKVNGVLSGIQPDMRDLVLVILNDPEYGGSGGAVAVVSTHPDVVEVLLHEMGHTLGLLADEYGGPPPPSCNSSVEPVEVNVTRAASGPIKWSTWIAPGTPLPTPGPSVAIPGLYQGGKYCDSGLYRPTYNSKMRSLFVPFEQINTEQLIKRIYNLASPIDGATPAGSTISLSRTESQVLRVATTQPLTRALETVWRVDGTVAGSGTEFTLNGASLSVGTHTVEVTVSDPTPLVSTDAAGLLVDVLAWNVTVVSSGGDVGGATATFVKADPTTQGSWRGVYGRDSAAIVRDAVAYPSYAQVSVTGADVYTWDSASADPRALERSSDASRIAATWFGDVVNIDINLTDGQPHRVALYSLDFDVLGRHQRIDVRDAVSGALLNSQTLTDFSDGRYLVWQLTGHVIVQVTRLGGVNAVVSGLFFDPPTGSNGGGSATATFVTADPTTQGSWRGAYGSDGGAVVGDTSAYPAYAQVAITGAAPWTWAGTTTDPRGLQRMTASTRIAATWFGDVVNIDINLTDGQPHRVALYSLDFDVLGRHQRIDVRDAVSGALLNSQTLTDFSDGRYLVWQLTGHVIVQVTRLGGVNAVVSGLFFDPPTGSNGGGSATATFVTADPTTQGSWRGAYGSDGGAVVGDTSAYPAYAQVAITGAAPWTWAGTTTDPRGLQRMTASTRIAATWFGDVVNIDINLTDGQPHRVALYSLDFDVLGRHQRIDVRDAVSGALLNSQTLTDFSDGRYLVWQLTGHVIVQVTRLGGVNAVVSGLFFDPPTGSNGGGSATATFVTADPTTQGSWRGAYGSDGGAVVGDTSAYPAYAQVAITGAAPWTWAGTTTDPRGLQRMTASTRIAATWFGDVVNIDINLTDGQPHRVALYSLDFDVLGRHQRIDVRDAVSGALLNSQTLTDFSDGRYLVWQLTGHVIVQVTRLGGVNAVVSGLFFDPGGPVSP